MIQRLNSTQAANALAERAAKEQAEQNIGLSRRWMFIDRSEYTLDDFRFRYNSRLYVFREFVRETLRASVPDFDDLSLQLRGFHIEGEVESRTIAWAARIRAANRVNPSGHAGRDADPFATLHDIVVSREPQRMEEDNYAYTDRIGRIVWSLAVEGIEQQNRDLASVLRIVDDEAP